MALHVGCSFLITSCSNYLVTKKKKFKDTLQRASFYMILINSVSPKPTKVYCEILKIPLTDPLNPRKLPILHV